MTTIYTPTGQVTPVPDYTLPQDVVDLVVVETVNNPFVTAADNIAWQLLAAKSRVNVANFGAVGDGSDSTSAQDAAVAALEAAGGGVLVYPPGIFKRTTRLLNDGTWSVMAEEPGATTILTDSATADGFEIGTSNPKSQVVIYGINFEAAQADSGSVFKIDAATTLMLVRCSVNRDASLFQGLLINDPSNTSQVVALLSDLNSAKTSSGEAIFTGVFQALGGELSIAPAATDNLIFPTDSALLFGVKLTHASTGGGISFLHITSGVRVRVMGCEGNVSGGSGTSLLEVVSGATVVTSGNDLGTFSPPYKYVSGPMSGNLQLVSEFSHAIPSGTTYTLPDGYSSYYVSFQAASAPSVTLPHILFFGQPMDLAVRNKHGSGSWAGAVAFPTQGSDSAFFQSSGLDGLPDQGALTLRWTSLYYGIENTNNWTQIGAAVQLT